MKIAILTGGDWPTQDRVQAAVADAALVLCCDGAADRALLHGIVPDVLVGDMDSISQQTLAQLREQHLNIRQLPCRKDMTDTFEACEIALQRGATQVAFVGGFGQRMDHSLGNMHCLMYLCQHGVQTAMETGPASVYATRDTLVLHGQQGKTFSLIPLLPDTHIARLAGASYPLTDAALPMGHTLGVSNVVTQEEVEVDVDRGMVLCLLYHALP